MHWYFYFSRMAGHSKTPDTYVLVETAAGYCLALVKSWSAIDGGVVAKEFSDPGKFKECVVSKGFCPFKEAEQALANIQAIAKSEPTELLRNFLSSTLPSKKKKYQLGVIDAELAKHLAKDNINVIHGKDVFEVIRACRQHLEFLVPTLKGTVIRQFQLGLGHSFSRTKIVCDPARQDKHCQQAVATMELSEKTLNKFSMRLREWYGWHFPELLKIVTDNKKFAECVKVIGRRLDFDYDSNRTALLVILDNCETMVDEIGEALKMSMGQDIIDADWNNITAAADQVLGWFSLKHSVHSYLGEKMQMVAPNLKALIGDQLGGKLITQAGSVTHLAKAPASTIQILGAEKALFRALKSRGPTPKYGLIYNSGFIGKAATKNKGRISRFLANKIALASRIDAFGETTGVYGEEFKKQVEERLKFLTDGVTPTKNIDVMIVAAERINQMKERALPKLVPDVLSKPAKVKKTKSKRKHHRE